MTHDTIDQKSTEVVVPEAASTNAPVSVTHFESKDNRLTKYITRENNRFHIDSATQLFEGTARRAQLNRLQDIEPLTKRLSQNQCIGTGVFDRDPAKITTQAMITKAMREQGYRTRSKADLQQPELGLVCLDYDPNDQMPEHLRCKGPEELMARLGTAMPELRGLAYSAAPSASAGIHDTASGEQLNKDGFHVYIQYVKTSDHDLRVLRDWLEHSLWQAGEGYIYVSRNGSMLPRTVIDLAVISCERLIYEAPPVLDAGIAQEERKWTHHEGASLRQPPSLTDTDKRQLRTSISQAEAHPRVVTLVEERSLRYRKIQIDLYAETHTVSIEEATAHIDAVLAVREHGKATSDLYLDDVIYGPKDTMSIETLLAQGVTMDRQALPDPIEGPEYGRTTAMFFFNDGKNPIIHSFAHGLDTNYRIHRRKRPVGVDALQTLDAASFPHTKATRDGLAPKSTVPNLKHILSNYGITLRYNVISKGILAVLPGLRCTPENAENTSLSHIISLCSLNSMPVGQVGAYLSAIADENPYNPALDWVRSEPWDGADRLAAFCATLKTKNDFPQEFKDLLMTRWMISAIAAIAKSEGFHSRGVLVLQGAQSIGKTTWVRSLVPDPLLNAMLLLLDHHLDPGNKDTLIAAISHWIVELGELESTFKQKEVARIKHTVTSTSDTVRRPYAQRESKYPRRTVFCATVNKPDFLVDDTGNTRWWVLPVEEVHLDDDLDMQQVWAQVHDLFKQGQPWWLSPEEEARLEDLNSSHRTISAIEQTLRECINFTDPKHGDADYPVNSATATLNYCGLMHPSNQQAREAGRVLRDAFGDPVKSSGVQGWRLHLPNNH